MEKTFVELMKEIKSFIENRKDEILESYIEKKFKEDGYLDESKKIMKKRHLEKECALEDKSKDYLDDILECRKELLEIIQKELLEIDVTNYEIEHSYYTEGGCFELMVVAYYETKETDKEFKFRMRYEAFLDLDTSKLPTFEFTDYSHLDLIDGKYIEVEYGGKLYTYELRAKNINKYLEKTQEERIHFLMSAGESLKLINIE